jgi:hypothetical protein
MFQSKKMKPLESDINYIIIENRKITRADLCRQLICPEIPQSITVVHREWLEQCLNKKALLDVAAFVVDLTAVAPVSEDHTDTDTPPVSKIGGKEVVSSFTSESESFSSNLKRKRDDDESGVVENNKQIKKMEFTSLDPASSLKQEFNTLFTEAGKPSLLYKFAPLTKPTFSELIAFDMDGTLITTKSGATFSKSIDDWKFLYPNVPAILREKYDNGAHLAIISNQNGIAKGHVTLDELTKKLASITAAIGE